MQVGVLGGGLHLQARYGWNQFMQRLRVLDKSWGKELIFGDSVFQLDDRDSVEKLNAPIRWFARSRDVW